MNLYNLVIVLHVSAAKNVYLVVVLSAIMNLYNLVNVLSAVMNLYHLVIVLSAVMILYNLVLFISRNESV